MGDSEEKLWGVGKAKVAEAVKLKNVYPRA